MQSIDVTETPETQDSLNWLDVGAWSSWILKLVQRYQELGIKTNTRRLERAKSLGFNMIHPVPPGKSYAHDGDSSAIHA